MPPATVRPKPSIRLDVVRWLAFTARRPYRLDTCKRRAEFIGVGYAHLNTLEQTTADGLSRDPIGGEVIAKIMLAFPSAGPKFWGPMFVAKDGTT